MKFKDWNQKEHELPKGRIYTWRPSAYAYVVQNDRTLLIRAKQHGRWELPGGGINLNESILTGLEREVFEETGYRIKTRNAEPYYIFDDFFYALDIDKYWHTLCMFFNAKLVSDEQISNNIDFEKEVKDIAWLTNSQIRKLDLQPKTKEAILLKLK